MDITIYKNESDMKLPEGALGFGQIFSPHMFLMDYTDGGWINPRIVPFQNLSLHPASTVFHYGAEVFEGLKAYRSDDGGIQLFRPMDNIRRMNRSADRLKLPTVDEEFFLEAIRTLVVVDADLIPSGEGESLYIRPFIIGIDPYIGVSTVKKALFVIIASPSGAYYSKSGFSAVKIKIEERDVRTVRGGTGSAKCGGNYAASVRAGYEAGLEGYSQVLWLDGVERRYVEEVGAMNVMFRIDDTIVTPQLGDSILDGITRRSCIELLKDKGYAVEERLLPVDELVDTLASGRLKEAFGTGTAAVVSPISHFNYQGRELQVGNGEIGELSLELYKELSDIQRGRQRDTHGWIMKL